MRLCTAMISPEPAAVTFDSSEISLPIAMRSRSADSQPGFLCPGGQRSSRPVICWTSSVWRFTVGALSRPRAMLMARNSSSKAL